MNGGGKLGEVKGTCLSPDLIRRQLAAKELPELQKASIEALNTCHDEDFPRSLNALSLDALIDLLEFGVSRSPEKLVLLMRKLDLHILRGTCSMAQEERIAKLALQFLKADSKELSFEAASILKDLKLPQSYPGIIKLLENGVEIDDATKRMLKSAAENIAVSVSISVHEMAKKYRSRGWKQRIFFRMKKHKAYLDSIGDKKPGNPANGKVKK